MNEKETLEQKVVAVEEKVGWAGMEAWLEARKNAAEAVAAVEKK